jgi:ADP-dependent NAD(P)H-hydrate dehydratase / NAD(P)H-hydrate epimerase
MMKVVTAEQMQAIDAAAADRGLTTDILMENAGRAVAEQSKISLNRIIGKSILILIGPGNNGGDGLVAARYLDEWGAEVSLYLCGKRKPDDKNLHAAQEHKIPVLYAEQDKACEELCRMLENKEVIIDAIFGTGKSRTIEGINKTILDTVIEAKNKRPDLFIIAVDLPSGLDANTGTIDNSCLSADITITLGYPKPGLYNFPGADKAGRVTIVDIGTPPELADTVNTELIEENWVNSNLPSRPRNANKGTFGKLLVVAGSINYSGAAYLACMGACRSGTGLVTLAIKKSMVPVLASKLTETVYLPLEETGTGDLSPQAASMVTAAMNNCNALLIGCGLGQDDETKTFIKSILNNKQHITTCPIIIDADALNTLSEQADWWQRLGENVILTPHPGEMSRLAGISIKDVQKDRVSIAREKATEWKKIVVLKGAYTVIASQDGRVKISTAANPALASAGTGDVLAGIIAGLTAQGMPPFEAAACGVYLHSESAAEVAANMGTAGMIASDLLPVVPAQIKKLREKDIYD